MSLLDYNKNELSGEDLLERDCQLYKFVKKNYCDILEIIHMITGKSYNIYENYNIYQDNQENKKENDRENNVLVYLEDEGFCFEFYNNNVFNDIDIISEILWLRDHEEFKNFYFYEEMAGYYDRFYKINSYDKNRMIEYKNIEAIGLDNRNSLSDRIKYIKSLNTGKLGDELINQMKAEEEFLMMVNNDMNCMTDDKLLIYQSMNEYKFKVGFGE